MAHISFPFAAVSQKEMSLLTVSFFMFSCPPRTPARLDFSDLPLSVCASFRYASVLRLLAFLLEGVASYLYVQPYIFQFLPNIHGTLGV
jgi:hypothetical protein